MSTTRWDQADNRVSEVSLIAGFLIMLQLLKANASAWFPDASTTIIGLVDFYFPMTITALVGVLYLFHEKKIKHLPKFPTVYLAVRRYVVGFLGSIIAVLILLSVTDVTFTTFDYTLTVEGWVIQLIVATMENLPLVMFMPVLLPFNLGGSGIKELVIEYIPSGIVAALSHYRVYSIQAQQIVAKQQENGIYLDPTILLVEYMLFAFIAFTIFYIVYKKLGFSYSVALHQVWNLLNGA